MTKCPFDLALSMGLSPHCNIMKISICYSTFWSGVAGLSARLLDGA